jgi:hypothetical protein
MGLYVCRLLTVLGLLLLLAGSAAIIIGYCLPQEQNIEGELMRISIDQDEEGNFYVLPERLTEVMAQLQDPMHKWKMIGKLFPLPLPLPSHFLQCHSFSSIPPIFPRCRILRVRSRRFPDGPVPARPNAGPVLWRLSTGCLRLGRQHAKRAPSADLPRRRSPDARQSLQSGAGQIRRIPQDLANKVGFHIAINQYITTYCNN